MAKPLDLRQWVTPEDLNVAPEVLGLALATPGRRLAAMLLDLTVISLLSALANVWWFAALALVGIARTRRREGAAPPRRPWLLQGAVLLLVAAGAVQAWQDVTRPRRGVHSVTSALEDLEDADAAPMAASASRPAEAGSAAAMAAMGLAVARQSERIHQLEARLADAQARRSLDPRAWIRHWADELGLGYGFALLYFTLLPAWWGGQTVGKRLLGLRVVELTGKPMTMLRNLKRFGGYAAGMATGGLGLVQLVWDSNRQAIQDKTAHTAVVDLRRPRLALPAATAIRSAADPIASAPISPPGNAPVSPPPATTSPP